MSPSARTIAHHLSSAWTWRASVERCFFCDEPACAVAYFGDNRSTIIEEQLRTRVGLKAGSGVGLLRYYFGITGDDYSVNPATRYFVVAQTAAGLRSCTTSNPSGRCCLKDFPKPLGGFPAGPPGAAHYTGRAL